MKRICFVAQFPPPMHGLSKAVQTLYESDLNQFFDFEKVNITDNNMFLRNLWKIFRSRADLFYFTLSQTKWGNVRDLIILKLLDFQNKRCLIHLHGGYYRKMIDNTFSKRQRRANYNAISKLSGAIVLSEALKPIFQGMIDDEKIHVVTNCIDDEFLLSKEQLIEKQQRQSEKLVFRILYLSNFITSKGYPIVLEMAKMEKERILAGYKQRFHFDFAGAFFDDFEKNFFFNYIEDNKLKDIITYHGIVGGEKKRKLLYDCDIFALPTSYPKEGQPISILEAMGNGMFIVTTDHNGIPDIVSDGVNGIVSDINHTDARYYFSKINEISYDVLASIGRHNADICNEFFTAERYIENMRKCFESIM